MWHVVIVGIAFAWMHVFYDPIKAIYKANNYHRSYEFAIAKERAHKKKLEAEESA